MRVMKSNESAEKYFTLAENHQRTENVSDALIHYNLCLCAAPSTSKLIFASFVNRSKIYYKVKQFQRALDNLCWAQKIKPFDNGCTDLLDMVGICKAEILRSQNPPQSTDCFELTLPINEKVPFVSACLELKENEIYGRYFVTSKDLQPGDVFVAEEPFFKVIDPTVCHLRCSVCCSTNFYCLIPCDNCTAAMFCSDECKRSTIHGRECGIHLETLEEYMLQRMFYQTMDICGSVDQLKQLLKSETTAKTILDFDFSHTTGEAKKRKIIQSVSGLDKRDPGSVVTHTRYRRIIDRLIAETSTNSDDFLRDYLNKCLQSLTVNFFHFFWSAENHAEGKGFALCALSAFFSHSCDPNIEKVDVDNKLVFVARKPIKAGEQLNMCYDRYNFMRYSLDERQRYLKDVYDFGCNCAACVNDYPKYDFEWTLSSQLNIEAAKDRYRNNCEFIRKNISSYPCQTICSVVEENVFLLSLIGNRMPF